MLPSEMSQHTPAGVQACVRACVYIYRISTLYNRLYNIYTVYCAKMVGDNLKGKNK